MKSGPNEKIEALKRWLTRARSAFATFFQKVGSFFKGLYHRILGRVEPVLASSEPVVSNPTEGVQGGDKPVTKPVTDAVVTLNPEEPVQDPAITLVPKENDHPKTEALPASPSEIPSSEEPVQEPILEPKVSETMSISKTEEQKPAEKPLEKTAEAADDAQTMGSTLEQKIARKISVLMALSPNPEQIENIKKEYETLELKDAALNEVRKEILGDVKAQYFAKLEKINALIDKYDELEKLAENDPINTIYNRNNGLWLSAKPLTLELYKSRLLKLDIIFSDITKKYNDLKAKKAPSSTVKGAPLEASDSSKATAVKEEKPSVKEGEKPIMPIPSKKPSLK